MTSEQRVKQVYPDASTGGYGSSLNFGVTLLIYDRLGGKEIGRTDSRRWPRAWADAWRNIQKQRGTYGSNEYGCRR